MYFVCLATALKDATKPEDLRQLAGVALKNALTAQVRRGCTTLAVTALCTQA